MKNNKVRSMLLLAVGILFGLIEYAAEKIEKGKNWAFIYLAISFVFGLMAFAEASWGAEVVIGWDPVPQGIGVRVYVGTETAKYTASQSAIVGDTRTTIKNLIPGTKYFLAAKAFDSQERYSEAYSNEVFYTPPAVEVLPPLPKADVAEIVIKLSVVPAVTP